MTERKALEFMRLFREEWDRNSKTENAKALDVAIKALEKQIPKKPLFGTVHNDTTYHCSNCKKFIGFYDTRIYEYCHNCGQKLDWQTQTF